MAAENTSGADASGSSLVDDMMTFLNRQPNKELFGCRLAEFTNVYPTHKGCFLLKKLAKSRPDCFRWVQDPSPARNKIILRTTSQTPSGAPTQDMESSLVDDMVSFLRLGTGPGRVDAARTPAVPASAPGSARTPSPVVGARISVATSAPDPRTVLVDTIEELVRVTGEMPFTRATASGEKVVAVDCEGVPDALYLIQIATPTATWVFDCVTLSAIVVCRALRELLEDVRTTKLFHDLHKDAAALAAIGGVRLRGTLDTQLAMESLTGELHMGFNQMLKHLRLPEHMTKSGMKSKMQQSGWTLFAQRPLTPDLVQYAADDVALLVGTAGELAKVLGLEQWSSVQRASDARASAAPETKGARQVCFDVSKMYTIASLELLREQRPGDILAPTPLTVSDDTSVLLNLLPLDWANNLAGRTAKLSDINIDLGRAPHAWIDGARVFLEDQHGQLVEQREIDVIVAKLGKFGTDNRAGLEHHLHRISAVRNRSSDIIGLTMRVGRYVKGNADMISDLLFADSTRSILFLGEPGSGKTTVVREATRLLAKKFSVCIVDTSNEIAGDGNVPHTCVGFARRLMVPCLNRQAEVMIECVQNHTPGTMVIDEIGRSTEVEAAQTCKQRGVRMIASAHGDLRSLIKNPKLRGLVGGVERVIIGDEQAKFERNQDCMKQPKSERQGGKLQKVKAQRAGAPTFDVIVELRRGVHHEWRVVLDVAGAVDQILDGEQYKSQLRTRNPKTGTMHIELGLA
jgi:stage III sporulation protein SpoIIIAA